MRLFRRWAPSSVITMFVLALPLSQAQAEDCVQFSGLKHCAVGSARLELQAKELTAHAGDTSGTDGVAIETLGAQSWSAGQTCEPSDRDEETTVTTFQAAGQVVATSTVTDRSDGQTISASFVDANGKPTTYSVMVFSQGRLVATVRGLPSGSVAATSSRGHHTRPTCTHLRPEVCRSMCIGGGIDCAYCDVPCRKGIGNGTLVLSNGQVPRLSMTLMSPFNGITPGDVAAFSAPVEGDELVLVSDAPSAGAAQDVDLVLVESTAKTVSLSDESTTHR